MKFNTQIDFKRWKGARAKRAKDKVSSFTTFNFRKIGIFSRMAQQYIKLNPIFLVPQKILKIWKKSVMKNVDWRYDDDGVRSRPIIKQ